MILRQGILHLVEIPAISILGLIIRIDTDDRRDELPLPVPFIRRWVLKPK
jgi:hypothetical protein